MSKRTTRSMTAKEECKQKARDPKAEDSDFDPLGFFCLLPTEIIQKILYLLPKWQNVLGNWMDSKQTIKRFLEEISEHMAEIPESMDEDQKLKEEESIMSLVGDIMRKINLSRSVKQKIQWMQNLLFKTAEQWNPRGVEFRYLGFFFKSFLKSSSDEDMQTVVETVCSKFYSRLVAAIGFDYVSKEESHHLHQLFPEQRMILAAANFLLRRFEPVPKARLARGLFLPKNDDTGKFPLLGSLLNKWWKENEQETLSVIEIIMQEPQPWGHFRVAKLFAELEGDLVARIFNDDFEKMKRVFLEIAEINGESAARLIDTFEKEMTDTDFNEFVSHIEYALSKEVKFVQRRCRMSFTCSMDASPFAILHNLELVRTAIEKMRFKRRLPAPK